MSMLIGWILSLEAFNLVIVSEKYYFIWQSWDSSVGEVEL